MSRHWLAKRDQSFGVRDARRVWRAGGRGGVEESFARAVWWRVVVMEVCQSTAVPKMSKPRALMVWERG